MAFAGQGRDAASGLYHLRARQYDPATGRCTSPDPTGYAGGGNLYAYAGNNPATLVDPEGEAGRRPRIGGAPARPGQLSLAATGVAPVTSHSVQVIKAQRLARNSAGGGAFEAAVLQARGWTKNTTALYGQTRAGVRGRTIPDVVTARGITDIKDEIDISFDSQLQIQRDIAGRRGGSFNLVVSSRNRYISQPLLDAIRQTGGIVVRYDPATGFTRVGP